MKQTGEFDIDNVSEGFRMLGDPTRLRILRFLADCGDDLELDESGSVTPLDGVSVGDVCCHLTGDTKGSSLVSHHLKELRVAGLIEMKRSGRKIHCRIYSERLSALLQYLEDLTATAEPKLMEASDELTV